MNKLVTYKGIIHERSEDAPFMGALIIAPTCSNNCRGCFNRHLKDAKAYTAYASDIIEKVKSNPFNDGIILAGLEWSEHPDDLIALVYYAQLANLQVIVYTGLTEDKFYARVPRMCLRSCYIKFGEYDSSLAASDHYSCGVRLASTNQYILRV